MKKSLYMWIKLVHDEDIQDYVQVSMSTMKLVIFDLRSLSFIKFCFDMLFRKYNYIYDTDLSDCKLMINVSPHKRVLMNLYVEGNCLVDASLSDLISAYQKPKDERVYFSAVDDTPDILKLLSYFLTEKQIKSSYIQFKR